MGRTLYDLTPGKLFVFTTDTLIKYGRPYSNERDLWFSLNPSALADFSLLDSNQQHRYLNNRVGRYLNTFHANVTELGTFYFGRNPNYLAGLAKQATPLYGITVDDGLATWYPNNSSVSIHNRLTVRINLINNKLSRDGTQFISADNFTNLFPDAPSGLNSTYQLTLAQLASLPLPTNINNKVALFSITALGLVTWHRNKSVLTNISRQQVQNLMLMNKASSTGIRYIKAEVFLQHYPDAIAGPGRTYKLTTIQMKSLPNNN